MGIFAEMFIGSKLYQRLLDAFTTCHPDNGQAINQAYANELWMTIKLGKDGSAGEVDLGLFNAVIEDLEENALKNKQRRIERGSRWRVRMWRKIFACFNKNRR